MVCSFVQVSGLGASVCRRLPTMAWRTQHLEVRDVVRAALAHGHDVVALPRARLQIDSTRLAFAVSPLETVLTVPRILRVFVVATVRVPGVPLSLIQLRVMLRAIVPLRRATTDQARARAT